MALCGVLLFGHVGRILTFSFLATLRLNRLRSQPCHSFGRWLPVRRRHRGVLMGRSPDRETAIRPCKPSALTTGATRRRPPQRQSLSERKSGPLFRPCQKRNARTLSATFSGARARRSAGQSCFPTFNANGNARSCNATSRRAHTFRRGSLNCFFPPLREEERPAT